MNQFYKNIFIKSQFSLEPLQLDKASIRVRRKRSGCNESEHIVSLVKIENRDNLRVIKMDETLFYERSQYCMGENRVRHTTSPGC